MAGLLGGRHERGHRSEAARRLFIIWVRTRSVFRDFQVEEWRADMKKLGVVLLVMATTSGFLLARGAVSSAADPSVRSEQLKVFEGNWSGIWRSARGNTGSIGIVIQIDSVTNRLKGSFFEVGRTTSKWQATGQMNEKGEVVFPGDDFPGDKRTDTVWLEEGGKVLLGAYKYQKSSSTGTYRLQGK